MPNIPTNTDYKHTRVFKKKSDVNRSYSKPEHAKLYYSRRWRNLRNLFIQRYPLCKECKGNNIIKQGKLVDHIKPVSEGGDFYLWRNLQTLCNTCHRKKSAREVNNRVKKLKNNNSNV
jgi:5-methylcytosine-specific restriction protein A